MPLIEPSIPKNPQILSVSKLTRNIKLILEEKYPIIWIFGEISNLRIPASGHAYFTLKDERSQIASVFFKGQLQRLKFKFSDGMSIVAMGRISVYEPRGTYQIILEYAEPQGFGALQIAFEQLKEKLGSRRPFQCRSKNPLAFVTPPDWVDHIIKWRCSPRFAKNHPCKIPNHGGGDLSGPRSRKRC